jgi:HK97 family phage major capsid protein
MPDDRIGVLQERIAREMQDSGVTAYEPPGASMYVPLSVLNAKRDLSVAAQGGAVVQTDVKPEIEAFLYPFSAVVKLGATVLDGLRGNVNVPIGRASLPVAWDTETGSATEADPTVGSFSMTPHNITAQIAVSRSLLVQSPGVEAWIKREIGLALGTEIDRIALFGTGSGQPTGIFNTPTAQTVTFAAAATWAKVVLFETLAGQANARRENCSWIVGANSRSKWKQAVKTGTGAVGFIMDSDHTVNGYRAEATSKLDATNQVVYGDFSECYLGSWGSDAIQLVVDNITGAKVGKIVITANAFCDVAFRRANLLVTSTDSAAQ